MIDIYKKMPLTQKWLSITGQCVRRFWHIEKKFTRIAPRGEAAFQYRLGENCVEVTCDAKITRGDHAKICLMNEMGGDFFANAWIDGRVVKPPTAWEKINSASDIPYLFSGLYNMRFRIQEVEVADGLPYTLFWGREKTAELCWAGYTIEIDLNRATGMSASCRYKICWDILSEGEPAG